MKKMEWIGYGFDLDLIWVEIGVFKKFKECARSPCNGNHFSSLVLLCWYIQFSFFYFS